MNAVCPITICTTGNNAHRPRMVGRLRAISRECDTGTPVLVRFPNGRGEDRWVPGWTDEAAYNRGGALLQPAPWCDDVPFRYMKHYNG